MKTSNEGNLLLAFALSMVILIGYDVLFLPSNKTVATDATSEATSGVSTEFAPEQAQGAIPQSATSQSATSQSAPRGGAIPKTEASPSAEMGIPKGNIPQLAAATPSLKPNGEASATARYHFRTDVVVGSINLKGAVLDDLTLTKYKQTLAEDSPEVRLLTPSDYGIRLGWASGDGSVMLPDENTLWEVTSSTDASTATPTDTFADASTGTSADAPTDASTGSSKEIVLRWQSPQGILFEQVYNLSEDYLFRVTQRVTRKSAGASGSGVSQSLSPTLSPAPFSVAPYGLIVRRSKPEVSGFFILHEGAIGYLNEELVELDYEDIQNQQYKVGNGGWLGITDKYWLTALVPTQSQTWQGRFIQSGNERYQVDYLAPSLRVAPNEPPATYETTIFAGAKELSLLDKYQNQYQIPRFELAVDFGWFYFLTKPIFYLLDMFSGLLGNFGLAILALTVVMRLLLYPLANKSFTTMHKMKKLQPEMVSLQQRFKEDKAKLRLEMMGLYKKHKLNPAAGCLPVLLQIPIFFSLYKVLFISIEMRQAPFYLWVRDLSAPDPTSILNLFGVLPYGVPAFLGILPILMGLSIWVQQKLSPKPADPIQAKVMSFLPWVFMLLLASFPSGLLIYWTWNNILSILQQYILNKKLEHQ